MGVPEGLGAPLPEGDCAATDRLRRAAAGAVRWERGEEEAGEGVDECDRRVFVGVGECGAEGCVQDDVIGGGGGGGEGGGVAVDFVQGERAERQGGEEGGVAGDCVGGRRDRVGVRQAVIDCGEALCHEMAEVGGRGDARVGGCVVVGEVFGSNEERVAGGAAAHRVSDELGGDAGERAVVCEVVGFEAAWRVGREGPLRASQDEASVWGRAGQVWRVRVDLHP